jgi:hypothetical protein
MRKIFKASVAGALSVGLAATVLAGAAWAGPINIPSSEGIGATSLTDQVYYRRYYRHGYYRRGYYNPGAAAAAVGVLGAAAAGAYYSQPYYYGYPAYGYGYPAYGYPYGYGW